MIRMENKTYENTRAFARTCRNYVLEIDFEGIHYFVNSQTEDGCRRRADSIYGKGQWTEIVITTAEEALNGHKH